jgi:hypothetical protein
VPRRAAADGPRVDLQAHAGDVAVKSGELPRAMKSKGLPV